ncbi:HAMP domain-containing sensor histidine kinase [Candidatus Symbiobacter mobilis]|uniref:histidine kinase n=1 Tax=Candidatus Symbiobacter mobilis CR TaxID=946483 RepID=U5NCF6_9BURK|nr:sensor histidine kinase [Candidatus Symbiobacter mobilis]AGX87903.1 signal transduction histidine kinase [Candidatus Symbiobacter mobilis CR]
MKTIKSQYILTGLFISLLTVLTVSVTTYFVSYSITSKLLDERMRIQVRKNASELNLWFSHYQNLIEETAEDLQITQNLDAVQLQSIFANKVRRSHGNIKDLYLGDEENNKLIIASGWVPPPDYQVRSRPWFQDAIAAHGKVIVTKPYEDAILNTDHSTDFVMTVARTVTYQDKVFVLAADISLKHVIQIVQNHSFGPNSYAFLLDQVGNVIAHPIPQFLATKKGLKNIQSIPGIDYAALIRAMTEQPYDATPVWVRDADGVRRNVMMSEITPSQWILGVATDEAEYRKPLTALLYGFVAALLLSILISMATMLRLVRRMTKPIEMLNQAVHTFASTGQNAPLELHRTDELGQLAASFNDMSATIQKRAHELEAINHKLLELDAAKSVFLSTVSHELRTPLTSVVGFAKVIRKKHDEVITPVLTNADPKIIKAITQIRGNLDIIIAESERLTLLISDVLDITRMDAGKMEWKSESVDFADVLRRAMAMTSDLFEKKGIPCTQATDPELPSVIGDGERLVQALVNLLSNAAKFTDAGQVTCEARKTPQGILVRVTDTGVGIAPELHQAIFNKFKQVGDILSSKPSGMGLGLPICKEIVEHHGGRIWVDSEPGRGSAFFMEIPTTS